MTTSLRKLTLQELAAIQAVNPRDPMPVLALLENIRSMFNVGSFFRTADGAGAQGLILAGFTAHPPRKEISKVALGAELAVPWEHFKVPVDAARAVKSRGYRLIAVELTTSSRSLYDAPIHFPACFVFGHEVNGISEALLAECDEAIAVPMRGTKESLNVATCAGVVLFEVRRQFDLGQGEPQKS